MQKFLTDRKCWTICIALSLWTMQLEGNSSSPPAPVQTRSVISLDGPWLLAIDPENVGQRDQWWKQPGKDAKVTKVPWIIQDAFPGYHGVAWYWREFTAPVNPHRQGRCLLRFWAVDYKADVWVNGQLVGTHEGSEDPFVFDVTDAIKVDDTNLVAVRVLNPTHEPIDGLILDEVAHRNKVMPYQPGNSYNHGGITDGVELILAPPVRIEDVFVRPDVQTGIARIQVTVRNTTEQAIKGTLLCRVAPAPGGTIHNVVQQEHLWPQGESVVETSVAVQGFRLWNLNDPYLYHMTVQVQAEAASHFDEQSVRFGFRDFRFEKGCFRLNGKRVLLRSTHSGNHCPIGLQLPPDPDMLRRDLVNLKVMGFNTVRFSAGVPTRYQLDLCDEIGLFVWNESYAGWYLRDSSRAAERFDHSTRGMIKRDRNHPSVVIWGLLNENFAGPLFWHASKSLPMIRALDDTRIVMLNDGRHDQQLQIGPISNPGSMEWERVYDCGHPYRRAPHSAETIQHYRTLGQASMPYFMSEYGIGSAVDLMRVVRGYEQRGAEHVEDYLFYKDKRDQFLEDWQRWNLAEVFARPEDYFHQCLSMMAGQRLLGINAIRSNPNIIGFGVSGAVDQGMSGEGLTTTFRELKPGTIDAVFNGMAPLRWCLFVEPVNNYCGSEVTLEAVLANEDALGAGQYPVLLEVFGPQSECVFRRETTMTIPESQQGSDAPLALPVFKEQVSADWHTGKYRFVATFKHGAAAAGGEAEFYVTDAVDLPPVETEVVLWGHDEQLAKWLADHHIHTRDFESSAQDRRQVILVSDKPPAPGDREVFQELAMQIARGSTAIFLSPEVFRKRFDWAGHVDEPLGWLPLRKKGKLENAYNPGIYHPDPWARKHPIFEGLPSGGLMDYAFYREIISDTAYVAAEVPAVAVAGSINTSFGYWSGLLVSEYKLGAGTFILNTLLIRENLGKTPAAERLLRNMLRYAARGSSQPITDLPANFDEQLQALGL